MRVLKRFDPWNSPLCPCPPKYTVNPYTGCGFKCLYCYITSYIKDGFNPRPKKDIIKKLRSDLRLIEGERIVAISYSTDPYTPPEGKLRLTRRVLDFFAENSFSLLVATKSPLIVRDIDILSKVKSVVSITITTLDTDLARKLEPFAPSPLSRLRAVERLRDNGIAVSLRIDPVIPYITDDIDMLELLIKEAYSMGVSHIVSSIYKMKPDSYNRLIKVFPWIRDKYRRLYGEMGLYHHGYRYAPYQYRYNILKRIRSIVKKYGIGFSTCREGLRFLDDMGTFCDGSHLIQ